MANIVFRRGSNKVYLYYYDNKANKLVQVPRAVTRSWDGLPIEEIHALKRKWEEDHGLARDRISRMVLADGDKLRQLWTSYQTSRMNFKKRQQHTADQENDAFDLYILEFFVKINGKKDPTHWHALVPDFHNWLFEKPIVDATRRKILWALERFGKHLVFSRVMTFPFTIQTPTRGNSKETPLKARIAPEDLLQIVRIHDFRRPHKKHANPKRYCKINFKLAVLLGYFASLRPEELYALEKADFLTGDRAVAASKTYLGLKALGLGSKLAVKVSKAIRGNKVERRLKSHHSYGFVTIWDPAAAQVISTLIKDLPEGRLFPFARGSLDQAWRRVALPIVGCTAHDLRRASGLHLGRTVRIPLTLLQEHMRHAEVQTTMLYTRAPTVQEDENQVANQDFNDVV